MCSRSRETSNIAILRMTSALFGRHICLTHLDSWVILLSAAAEAVLLHLVFVFSCADTAELPCVPPSACTIEALASEHVARCAREVQLVLLLHRVEELLMVGC